MEDAEEGDGQQGGVAGAAQQDVASSGPAQQGSLVTPAVEETAEDRPKNAHHRWAHVAMCRMRAVVGQLAKKEGLPTSDPRMDGWLNWMDQGRCRCGYEAGRHCCPYTVAVGEADYGQHVMVQTMVFQRTGCITGSLKSY